MPLAFGKSATADLGKCKTHGVALVRRPRADLSEQIATERAALDAVEFLGVEPVAVPIPRQNSRRRGDCPRCLAEIGAAAVAFLHG